MQTPLDIATADKLIYRVKRTLQKGERISFLLGSGVTLPCEGFQGVPQTKQIIEIISRRFPDADGIKLFKEAVSSHSGAAAYQAAMNVLVQCEGQSALNEVIAEAVLEAKKSRSNLAFGDKDLEESEMDLDGWALNPGVSGIATLFNLFPQNIGPILTSNFDPLLGIAIKKLGGHVTVVPMIEDGALSQLPSSGPSRHIIHFHGYWRGTDTLHTSEQINRSRPRLRGELRKILEETTLVVIGYGGWSDVFMDTLYAVIDEGAVKSNVLWGFHNNDRSKILSENVNLLEKLSPQTGNRVVLYSGIDANIIFPRIVSDLNIRERQDQQTSPAHPTFFQQSKPIAPSFADPGCDTPPAREYWTGRTNELSALFSSAYKVSFITGIGGQGKSSLAAEFVRSAAVESDSFAFWDWRDCREEANRMHTNLASICYRLAAGSLAMEDLKEETEESLIDLLFQFLGERKALFIFDNVDEYIDLKTLLPHRAVGKLVHAAIAQDHRAKFIFTCRPQVNFVASRSQQLAITGFSETESHALFGKYPIKCTDDELRHLSSRARELTDGHPLWLNIIAAQASVTYVAALTLIDTVKNGTSTASADSSDRLATQTLAAVWIRLNDKQKILLRGMSEAVCQQTEQELVSIMAAKLNYNGLNRSLKKLRELNLVVTRQSEQNVDSYDLHPLVRRFVRSRYSADEQRQFILLYIGYFDSLISKIKARLGAKSSFSDFSNWAHKIELEINRGRPDFALATLHEVSNQMIEAGYVEEYVRLADLVFSRLDWRNAIAETMPFFVNEVCDAIEILSQLGRYEAADKYLDHLQKEVNSSGVAYLQLCDAHAFRLWQQDRFLDAVAIARPAVVLKRTSGADVKVNVDHSLALALRDSKITANVEEALTLFLAGNTLDSVLNNTADPKGQPMGFYGNIGRCLQFLSRSKEAIECYKKSLQIAQSKEGFSTIRNTGYAYWWIGEIFAEASEPLVAAHFFKFAENVWKKTCPPRARNMGVLLDQLQKIDSSVGSVTSKSDLEIRSYCLNKLAK